MYLLDWIRDYRKKKYIEGLVSKGMTLGKNVYLNDGFFLDPAHCHLITIEDDVVFGPSVRLFAHDASSLKVIGKTRINFVHLKSNCFIGAGSTILPGVTVGQDSILGAGSVATTSIPDGELWGGVPARKLMSIEDYRKKLLDLPQNDFSQSEYSASVITGFKMEDMRRRIKEIGVGFMVRGMDNSS